MGVECYGFVCLCMPYSCLVHSLNRHRNEFREAHLRVAKWLHLGGKTVNLRVAKRSTFEWQICLPLGGKKDYPLVAT